MLEESRDAFGRPIIHFLKLITDEDREKLKESQSELSSPLKNKLLEVSALYAIALEKARPYGGIRHHTLSFGGGISFLDDESLKECLDSICENKK